MEGFHHVIPVTVRSRDIDAWGHVNNAVYFTYLEMARLDYIMRVILETKTRQLNGIGMILAEVACQFKKPIYFGQPVEVGTRVASIGTTSCQLEHRVEVEGQLAALGRGVIVLYDYQANQSIPIPELYRLRICTFEGKTL